MLPFPAIIRQHGPGATKLFFHQRFSTSKTGQQRVSPAIIERQVNSLETEIIHGDRRNHRRYQIDLDLSFRDLAGKLKYDGIGRIVNISSGGVLFVTTNPPPLSSSVELSVDWPCPGENGATLALFLIGRIVRASDGIVAVHTTRHEFRNVARAVPSAFAEAATPLQ